MQCCTLHQKIYHSDFKQFHFVLITEIHFGTEGVNAIFALCFKVNEQ